MKSMDVIMHLRLLTIVKRIRKMPNAIVMLTNACTASKCNDSWSCPNEYDWANYLMSVIADGLFLKTNFAHCFSNYILLKELF